MRRAVRTLRILVSRVHREVQRQLHLLPEGAQAKVQEMLQRTGRILTQRMKDKNKLYASHAPDFECISKGKARTPYEFGVKVSSATTLKEGLVVGMRSMLGNPYDTATRWPRHWSRWAFSAARTNRWSGVCGLSWNPCR